MNTLNEVFEFRQSSQEKLPLKKPQNIASPGGFQKKLPNYGSHCGDKYYLYKLSSENTIQYLPGKPIRKSRSMNKPGYQYLSENGQYQPITSDFLVRERSLSTNQESGYRRIISYFHTPNEAFYWINEVVLIECVKYRNNKDKD